MISQPVEKPLTF